MTGSHAKLFTAALETGRLTFIPNAVVSQITTAPGSRQATGVIYTGRIDHRTHECSGRIIVLCASTIESTRILLNSTAPDHPEGLGNSSGVVGRYLMDHSYSFPARLAGIIPHRSCDTNHRLLRSQAHHARHRRTSDVDGV
jgi:choline dehydrogenase-like flavoprotein